MSKKTEELAATAALLRQQQEQRTAPSPEPATPSQPAPASVTSTEKKVRLTVDVTPEQHQWLTQWGFAAAADLGKSRVPTQQLIRGLIALAADDPAVCEQAIQQLKNQP